MKQAPLASFQSALIPPSQNRPGDDPIFALHGEATRRAQRGESILNATIGALMESADRLAILPSVSEVLATVDDREAAAYAPIAGRPDFLAAVIDDLFAGTPLVEQAIAAATPGGTGAIDAAIVNFLDIPEKLLTTSYYWGPYRILAEHNRRGIATFEMFGSDGRLNVDAFEAKLGELLDAQDRVLVVLNSPCHNPTGYSLDREEWRAVTRILSAAAERKPIALLLDNAYAKFRAPGPEVWLEFAEELASKVTLLVAWTVSKAFAQYGARVGALIAVHPSAEERDRIKNALSYTCRGTWSNCNHRGMLTITRLLTDPALRARSESERQALTSLLAGRVEVFNQLASQAGLSYPRYEGGFFVSVFTPDAKLSAARMREDDGVYVVPINGAVRVAICATPRVSIPRLVESLAKGVRAAEEQSA